MNAVISGQSGRALLVDGDSLRSFDVDDPSSLVTRVPADFVYIFGEMQDLRVIENTDIDSVQQELRHDSDYALALELALISLDSELPNDIRQEALMGLDELLANDKVAERLENVLYARPVPEDADLTTALELSNDASLSYVSRLLRRLEQHEPFISEVSEAWDSIPTMVFGDYNQQAEFMRIAVREGLFRTLVIAREAQETTSAFLLNAGLNTSIKQLRNHRQVLQQWTGSFRRSADTPAINEIEEEVEAEASPRRRHGRRVGLDRAAVLKEVNRRKAIIVEALHRHDWGIIGDLVDDLVRYQRSGEPVHIAKSLCDLAMKAKELGMFPLQLELTERSINIASDDAWSWAQYGDALLNMHQMSEALTAYHQASDFGAGVIAKNGRAEVLKAQGQLPDALAAFDEVIREHPEDIVAKNGRAEVLKAQGQLPAALAAFDEVIRAHPEDVVAKTGRAEVLKAQGQLPAALAAFDDIMRVHPEDVVAKTGRAEVLKAQGQLPAALAAFDEVIRAHPENVVAKTGRAEVLKAQGQLPAALAAFDDIITGRPENVVARSGRSCVLAALGRYDEALEFLPTTAPQTFEDWIGYHIRGMILLRTGKRREAIQIFQEGAENVLWPANRDYFITALALAWMRNRDFKKAAEALEDVRSASLQPAANVLRIHAFGAQGDRQRATEAYDSLTAFPTLRSDELTLELHHQYILSQAPRHNEEWIEEREDRIILLAA
jgi:tetratricopeptide (TPR) repeat protein